MTKIIAILISTIFFFGFGDELALAVKKTTVLRVNQGLISPLHLFTRKMTQKNVSYQNPSVRTKARRK